jgi:hypothetical protein
MKSPFASRSVGGVEWLIRPEFSQALEPVLTDLALPVDNPRHTVFKNQPGGTAIFTFKPNRPDLPSELFVKIYRSPGWLPRFRRLLGYSPALKEWEMAQAHAERGLPVAQHLARGVRRRLGLVIEDLLLQESVANYHSFDEYFRTTFRPELPGVLPEHKRQVLRDLAQLIRKMHDCGIVRPELDPRNIMATRKPGGGVAMIFVDLAQARLRSVPRAGPVSFRERLNSLAHLNETLAPLLNRGYRMRFFRNYFRPDQLTARQLVERVEKIVYRSEQLGRDRLFVARRDVLRRRHPYYWFRAGDYRVFLIDSLYENELIAILDDLPRKPGERAPLRLKLVGEPRPLEVQVITCAPAGDLARRFSSPARSAFCLAAGLRGRQVPHRAVAAAIEARSRPGSRLSWLLMERPDAPGTVNLAEYLARKVADEFSGLPWDRTVLPRLARFILWLQDMNLIHLQATGENIWIRRTAGGAHDFLIGDLHLLRDSARQSLPTAAQYLADLFSVLPISESDGWMVVEEYLRFSRRFRGKSEEFRELFRQRAREWMIVPRDRP